MNLLATVVALFPLLLPIWQERPFTSDDTDPGPPPFTASIEQINKQAEGLAIADAELRSRLILKLQLSGREEALQLLVQQLQIEEIPIVTAAILQQLSKTMPDDSSRLITMVEDLLNHTSADIRYWAVRCYAEIPESDFIKLGAIVVKDKNPAVRRAALDILAERVDGIGINFYKQFWEDEDRHIRAAAVAGALRKPQAMDSQQQLLQICRNDEAVLVRQTMAETLRYAAAPELVGALSPVLAEDAHASVRGSVCTTIAHRKNAQLLQTLLQLSSDTDAEVRRLAVSSLSQFPGPETVDKLVERLADPRHLVRTEVEDSLVAVHDSHDVIEAAGARISDPLPAVRYHVYNILRRTGASRYDRIIARQQPDETVPRNIAAAIEALGVFQAKFTAETMQERQNHRDALVRQKLAEALGRIKVESTYPVLQRYAFDAADEVRQAAIISIGWIGNSDTAWNDDTTFSDTLLHVLQDFRRCSAANRAAVCWSAARLQPLNRQLLDRLVRHGTTAIVPAEMGPPMFEDNTVLASVSWALADMAKKDQYARAAAEEVIALHITEVNQDQMSGSGPDILIPSEALRDYARQAQAFMQGKDVEQRAPSPRIVSFDYRHYAPRPDAGN